MAAWTLWLLGRGHMPVGGLQAVGTWVAGGKGGWGAGNRWGLEGLWGGLGHSVGAPPHPCPGPAAVPLGSSVATGGYGGGGGLSCGDHPLPCRGPSRAFSAGWGVGRLGRGPGRLRLEAGLVSGAHGLCFMQKGPSSRHHFESHDAYSFAFAFFHRIVWPQQPEAEGTSVPREMLSWRCFLWPGAQLGLPPGASVGPRRAEGTVSVTHGPTSTPQAAPGAGSRLGGKVKQADSEEGWGLRLESPSLPSSQRVGCPTGACRGRGGHPPGSPG